MLDRIHEVLPFPFTKLKFLKLLEKLFARLAFYPESKKYNLRGSSKKNSFKNRSIQLYCDPSFNLSHLV